MREGEEGGEGSMGQIQPVDQLCAMGSGCDLCGSD